MNVFISPIDATSPVDDATERRWRIICFYAAAVKHYYAHVRMIDVS